MRYQLVALFDNDSNSYIETLQKTLVKKHKGQNVNHGYNIHITIDNIDAPDFEKLDELLTKVLKNYKKFKVELAESIFIDSQNRSISLKIENKGYIIRITKTINQTLRLSGILVRDNPDDIDLLIPVAIGNFSQRSSIKDEACATSNGFTIPINKLIRVDRLELWKTANNKKKILVKAYVLKTP